MSYIGNEPIVSATRTITEVTATAGQTVFVANGGYTVGYIDVFLNGAQLQTVDFTATNGSSITLTEAAQVGDVLKLVAWGTFQTSSALTANNPSYTGTLTGGTGVVNIGSGQVYKDASGNVGINTSSPTQALDVNGNILGAASITIGTSGLYQAGSIYSDSNWGMLFRAKQASPVAADFMWANSAGTERMRIDSSGNLLVGTTSQPGTSFAATSRLVAVYGQSDYSTHVRHIGASPYGLAISYSTAPNNTGNNWIDCRDTSAQRFAVTSNGGIRNFSANNVNLSDERTKTEINFSGSYLDKICAIPVKTFKYKDQTDDLLNLGVIAQDVEAIAPELVDVSGYGETPEDGVPLKAIYQTDLQYALMKCIQEQQAIITDLKSRIETLESK